MCALRSVCLVVLAAAVGCSPPNPGPEANTRPGPEPTTPATEEECRAVAVELEKAVRSGDRGRAIQAFTLEVVAHRVVTSLPVDDDEKGALLKLLPERADTTEIVNRVVGEVGRGGQFKLVRVAPADGGHKAIFRISNARLFVNYVDVMVARFPGGRVGVEDVVWVEDGDRLTELVRHQILPAAALRDPYLGDRLGEVDRLLLAHSKKVKDLNLAFRKGKCNEVITLYKGLPTALKDHKPLLLKYASACLNVGDPDRKTVLDTCRRQFPGDPGVELLEAHYHLSRRAYPSVGRIVDALRASIGEDALLDALDGLMIAATGRPEKGKEVVERAVAADPEMKMGYMIRILMALVEQNHADALAWMKRMTEKTGHEFGNLRQDPFFAKFVESPEFPQWLAWRATRHSR